MTKTLSHIPLNFFMTPLCNQYATLNRGGSRILGIGGLINIFTTGGGYGRGRAPPVTVRGGWGER